MGLPAPRLRDLNERLEAHNSGTERPNEVWEIGVPAKKSLSWSIILSILFSESKESFNTLLEKLTGEESEVTEIKAKKKLPKSKLNTHTIRQKLDNFNPFKNRHNFFHWKEVIEVMRIFNFRLNQYANSLRSRGSDWNDNLKLKAVSNLLKCEIKVYFPGEDRTRKPKFYSATSSNFSIILFQYENQLHGSRENPINIFYFAMTIERAKNLKLDALNHFLKKAKISSLSITGIKQLMSNFNDNGKYFLPAIIQSNYRDVLPEIYKSPYIAFKLSEAGFETNPIESLKDKPSALCYELSNADPKYLQVLYDYASNCRCLFDKSDRSVRKADNTILETLRQLDDIIENDLRKLTSNNHNFEINTLERALNILKQLKHFVKFQIKLASNLKNLREDFLKRSGDRCEREILQNRKNIITTILEHYLTFFRFESPKSKNIADVYTEYLKHTEYYRYADNFAFVSFFENFYKLKICFGLKEENLFLNIEWKIFLAITSNTHFRKFIHEIDCEGQHDKIHCDGKKNILRYIPLFHRCAIENEIQTFLQKLKQASNDEDLCEYLKEEKLTKNSTALPQVIDELLILRLKKYMEAALEVSPEYDGIKAVLVIERALQVIGESIKIPSLENSIVSFLLRSCLTPSLQNDVIRIRNDLSKYLSNLVYGKEIIEKDQNCMEEIKKALVLIQADFEIVYFTQYSRTEETVFNNCYNALKEDFDPDACRMFEDEQGRHFFHISEECKKRPEKFLKLLHNLFLDLRENFENDMQPHQLLRLLNSIEYLVKLILKYNPDEQFKTLLSSVKEFLENVEKSKENIKKEVGKDKKLLGMMESGKHLNTMGEKCKPLQEFLKRESQNLRYGLDSLFNVYKCKILANYPTNHAPLNAPIIGCFSKSLKKNMFTINEIEKIKEAVENALKEETDARVKLENIFSKELYDRNIDELLNRILIPSDKLSKLKSCFKTRDKNEAMKYLKSKSISETSVKSHAKRMLEEGSIISGYANTILIKIAFQTRAYPSATLPDEICKKLQNFLMKKVDFMISRLKALKNILIDEDEEIQATWKWGKSEAIKYHLEFLLRQRYIRETTVCASLEMAFFDIVNIFHEPDKEDDWKMNDKTDPNYSLRKFYKKSKDLFESIDLRNLVSHRSNIPEVIGSILDEDDFPSEMVKKMLELVSDMTAVETIKDLFLLLGAGVEQDFIEEVETSESSKHPRLVKDILECPRWKNYLILFPFIKT